MITIISGTNRIDSLTEKVSAVYRSILRKKNINAQIFSLKNVDVLHRNAAFLKIEKDILFPSQKFIFIIPEYNGTFPGVLKAMIDTSEITKAWQGKKALLTGVSSGRAGNLRGLDHMAACLHYLKMNVHYNKLPISVINKIMDGKGNLDDGTLLAIDQQLDEFLNF
jgi:NAD(P)H-dependent FMN reductase